MTMKKILGVSILASSLLLTASPALAARTAPAPANVACVQTAMGTRDSAISTAIGTLAAAWQAAISTRTSALQAAVAMTDKTQRQTARRAAWTSYNASHKTARQAY